MALRMLSYVVRALRHWQREREEAHEQLNEERVRAGEPKLPLEWEDYPLLFPMVIHSGEIKWTAPLNTKRLFGEVPGELRRYVPDFEYAVFEIRRLFCAAPELRDSLSAQWVRFVQAKSPAERVEPFREMLRLLDSVRYQPLNELRRTFFHWFEHCFREDKIPGDWRHLLNKVPLSEVSDMYALNVREWEKQVAARAAAQERREMEKKQREMEKKQRDTLRKIVRTKFGMSLPRWLSGERDMDRVQRLIIAASCAENAAAFQARLDQERGGVAECP